jgi:site-specific recombinase XerD
MGSMVSGLADAVLGVVEGVGLSADTVARYRKCCGVVVKFCGQRGLDVLSAGVVDEFVACQQERAHRGEIGPNRRNALVKSARMMLEFQEAGAVAWRMTSPDPDLALSESSRAVLKQFAAAASLELAPGSVRLLAGEVRQFLAYLDRAGQGALGTVTADDVRGFMVEVAPRRMAGTGNVVWSLKRFFAFLNAAGISDVRIDGLLAHAAPRRVRALPCFTREETGRLLEGIETGTPCGKRDYAMVALAVSTGLRCCDVVALRLDEIDWRRDEIRLVQAKTSRPLVLPLAGNAVAEWILHGRPDCGAPEVFVRLQPPHVKLGNSAGSTLMRRRLARAGIDHAARDGKSFHALRRTAGTRLIESGAGLPLAAQILGHARISSSGRYFCLASEQLRQCCLPLENFACTREGLR